VRGYRSGSDITLQFAGERQEFSAADFAERVAVAAARLGICSRSELTADVRDALVALAVDGRVEPHHPASGLALANAEEAAYWLRKLVFRSAWIDGGVEAGMIEARYDERTGTFDYRLDGHPLPAARTDDVPRLSPAAFRVE
jgi:hypothetical protein